MVRTTTLALATTYRKRGRPCKNRPSKDFGTLELQNKRQGVDLSELQLTGTLASMLLKERTLLLDDLEPLHKIYILRRRYLRLLKPHIDGCQSFISPVPSSHQKNYSLSFQKEDQHLEKAWTHLSQKLSQRDKNFIHLLDHLFSLVPYERIKEVYARFSGLFSPAKLHEMAAVAKEVWL